MISFSSLDVVHQVEPALRLCANERLICLTLDTLCQFPSALIYDCQSELWCLGM